jgi:hypothetical protein
MGSGRFDSDRYTSDASTRKSAGVPDFAYTASPAAAYSVHPDLDPKRINSKPFGKLESRDSDEHPESNAVLVCCDVTGSNIARARDVQQKLPGLMKLLEKYLSDPQLAIAGNDDYNVEPDRCIQISDFESDNRIDEHIRDLNLVGNGGGNSGESYDLLLYAAARKTVLDCFEKRQRKGYLFLYADEPIFKFVSAGHVDHVFDDKIEGEIPLAEIVEEVRKQYHLFVVWPQGGYDNAYEQYKEVFGEESVLVSQHPNLLCELIAATIGMNEDRITPSEAERDLIGIGTSANEAKNVVRSLARVSKSAVSKGSSPLQPVGSGSAERL